MTPSEAPAQGTPPAVFLRLEVIAKRADFLAASRAKRQATSGFVLQARNRHDAAPPRIGFTCSKKVGNAVARNRAKRRLREIARLVLSNSGKSGFDYVLIGRKETTAKMPFAKMQKDLETALSRIHAKP